MQVETTLDVKPLRGEVTSGRAREELCDAARPGKGWAGLKNQQKMGLKLVGGAGHPEMRLHHSWGSLGSSQPW